MSVKTCLSVIIRCIYFLKMEPKNGGEGLLTIANATSLEKEKVYDNTTLSWPSNLAVVGENLYIRDNNGVYMLDTSTEVLTFVEGTKGALKKSYGCGWRQSFCDGQ